MSTSVPANHPPFQPPEKAPTPPRAQESITASAVARAKQAADLAMAAAKAERARNRGQGTVVDVMA